ncbi:MAG: choloylglycine hydrolase family protein [Clostridia bacterium]|nr:choloylglycine hydrolase family protein [Clostridia bacterium]
MCTAISDNGGRHLFGRSLDLECSYGESVITLPRAFRFYFAHTEIKYPHYAMIGAGVIHGGVPLYYDGMNEYGLCAAALNFPARAVYQERREGKLNLASFELIPYVLMSCESLSEAREALSELNVTADAVSASLPPTPLHYMISDGTGAVVVEAMADGVHIHENPYGVLTNSPELPYQVLNLSGYMGLDSRAPENRISKEVDPENYSRGLGAYGLPGDYSSTSRFVRAVFLKNHTRPTASGCDVGRMFHIMDSLAVPDGAITLPDGRGVRTVYTSVADTADKIYYFTTYGCRRIRGVRLDKLEGEFLSSVSIEEHEDILFKELPI